MIRAVLDTNVLASGAIASAGSVADIMDAWNRYEFHVVLSTWIFRELARTLAKPYFSSRLSEREIDDFLSLLQERAQFVRVDASDIPRIATQREVDFVLATAVEGHVQYLVTGDRMVRALDSYQGIEIVTPREFLDERNDLGGP